MHRRYTISTQLAGLKTLRGKHSRTNVLPAERTKCVPCSLSLSPLLLFLCQCCLPSCSLLLLLKQGEDSRNKWVRARENTEGSEGHTPGHCYSTNMNKQSNSITVERRRAKPLWSVLSPRLGSQNELNISCECALQKTLHFHSHSHQQQFSSSWGPHSHTARNSSDHCPFTFKQYTDRKREYCDQNSTSNELNYFFVQGRTNLRPVASKWTQESGVKKASFLLFLKNTSESID